MTDQGVRREGGENRVRWRTAEGGLALPAWIAIGVAIAVIVVGFGAWWTYGLGRGLPSDGGSGGTDGMSGMDGEAPAVPAVHGFYAGQEVLFIHTEASDPQVAEMLIGMMGSPVIVVPELADVPEAVLGTVYVFTDGIRPDGPRGPFGFQPDVFDSAPGDMDYSPLRALNLVTWRDDTSATVLRSAQAVNDAIADGRLMVERPGVVVNMPFLRWPGGER